MQEGVKRLTTETGAGQHGIELVRFLRRHVALVRIQLVGKRPQRDYLLSGVTILETYEEANNSAATPNAITAGQKAEWDWVVQQNSAAPSTIYYFRMVKGDSTLLDTYTTYPQLSTAAVPQLSQEDYELLAKHNGPVA
jgi:hypothetical protein